jgi:hypothetical protein
MPSKGLARVSTTRAALSNAPGAAVLASMRKIAPVGAGNRSSWSYRWSVPQWMADWDASAACVYVGLLVLPALAAVPCTYTLRSSASPPPFAG